MLNMRQQNFCREYIVDGDAAKAYVRAGYSKKGSGAGAAVLLAKPLIVNEIRSLREVYYAAYDTSTPRIRAELEKIAFSVLGDYVTWDPNGVVVTESDKLTPDQMAALADVPEVREDGMMPVVKLHNKLQALQLLGKANGMFIDRTKVEAMEGAPIVVLPVMYRGDKEGGHISEDSKNENSLNDDSSKGPESDD